MADLHGGANAKITIKSKDWDASAGPQFAMAVAAISCKVDGFPNPYFTSQSPAMPVTSDGQVLSFSLPVPNPWANFWDQNNRSDIPTFEGELSITYINLAGIQKFNQGSAGGGIACWTDVYLHPDGKGGWVETTTPGRVAQKVNIKRPGT